MVIKRLDHVNFVTHDMAATADFYCNVIGLVRGEHLSIDTAESLYLYIDGQDFPVLHILNAKADKKQSKFERLATLSETNAGKFSTGAFDHFCLQVDADDYQQMIAKFKHLNVDFQSYCHRDVALKQVWLLDPNGVRVELNFI